MVESEGVVGIRDKIKKQTKESHFERSSRHQEKFLWKETGWLKQSRIRLFISGYLRLSFCSII